MKKYLFAIGLGLSPLIALANTSGAGTTGNLPTVNTSSLNTSIQSLTGTINLVVPLLLAAAVVIFLYGVIRFIIAKGGGEKDEARRLIVWTVIGLASVLAIWGLAGLLINFFGLTPTGLNNSLLPTVTPATAPTATGQ